VDALRASGAGATGGQSQLLGQAGRETRGQCAEAIAQRVYVIKHVGKSHSYHGNHFGLFSLTLSIWCDGVPGHAKGLVRHARRGSVVIEQLAAPVVIGSAS